MSGSERGVESPSGDPVPSSSGINDFPLTVGAVGKLSHYSSIGGSCNVAGAAVVTVSPGEFVPVATVGLLGLASPLMSKSPLLVVHGLGRGLEYYLGCVFS